MRNIIIDCDPGHDDAIAILMAAAQRNLLNIVGITTVGGNHELDKITINALKVLSLLKEDLPLAKGAAKPLSGVLRTGAFAHGDTGMNGPILPPPIYAPVKEDAVTWMKDAILNSSEAITLVPLAPLTNIAMLLERYPEVKDRIELISLMGGGIYIGNMTAAAEFNIYTDPEAARIVFHSGIPIVMSGLDVTNKAMIMDDEIEGLKDKGTASHFVYELLEFYAKSSKLFGFEGSALHDACAIAYLIKPELFEGRDYYVDIELQGELTRGMTLADVRPRPDHTPNTKVLLEVDRGGFLKLLLESLAILDKRLNEKESRENNEGL